MILFYDGGVNESVHSAHYYILPIVVILAYYSTIQYLRRDWLSQAGVGGMTAFVASVASTTTATVGFPQASFAAGAADEYLAELNFSLEKLKSHYKTNNNATKLTVYLVKSRRAGVSRASYSPFQTDMFPRYGSGRVEYHVLQNTQCDLKCSKPVVMEDEDDENNSDAPCLAVSHKTDCSDEHMTCNYPKCKHMLIGDEKCKYKPKDSRDVRIYYSDRFSNKGYVPLGMRLDSWHSFQNILASPEFAMKKSSERKFAFNAIYSRNTNDDRGTLADIIEAKQYEYSNLTIKISIPKRWSMIVNGPQYDQLDTDVYIAVVLDSVFTLAPAGHNPECYRLYETVEAGSIPVMVKSDLHYKNRKYHFECKEGLHKWYDAPMLVLDSWKDLFPVVEELMADKGALDEMQSKMIAWYDETMRKTVSEFEDFMLDHDVVTTS